MGILDREARPLTFETNHKSYCTAIRRTPLGVQRCRGSDRKLIEACDAVLPPIEPNSEFNHLSVRAAAAIVLDRVAGDRGE